MANLWKKITNSGAGAALGGAIAGVPGALLGAAKGGKKLAAQIGNPLEGPKAPNLSAEDARKLAIINQLAQGPKTITPELMAEADLQRSLLSGTEFDKIVEDNANISAQKDALDRYGEIADNGGFTAVDRAFQAKAFQRAAQQDAARRASILSEMQQRGTLGSGQELAAKLAAADAAGQQNSSDSMDLAAMGEQRRDQALQNRASLAGNLREQDYRVQSNRANAKDAVSRFNSELTNRMLQNNMSAKNQAAQWNAGTTNDWNQRVAELQYNQAVDDENRKLQRYGDKVANRNRQSQAIGSLAGAGIGGFFGGAAGAGLGSGLGSMAGGFISDENKKKDVRDLSAITIDSFLESIKPKSFDYKNPLHGEGKRVGFIAQDIEASPVGKAIVIEGDDGKEIDINNLLGAITAAVARLDQKKKDR